jgi:hypothetical protein
MKTFTVILFNLVIMAAQGCCDHKLDKFAGCYEISVLEGIMVKKPAPMEPHDFCRIVPVENIEFELARNSLSASSGYYQIFKRSDPKIECEGWRPLDKNSFEMVFNNGKDVCVYTLTVRNDSITGNKYWGRLDTGIYYEAGVYGSKKKVINRVF